MSPEQYADDFGFFEDRGMGGFSNQPRRPGAGSWIILHYPSHHQGIEEQPDGRQVLPLRRPASRMLIQMINDSGLPPPFKSVVACSPPESPLSSYDNGYEFATDNTSLPSVFRVSRSSWACAA